MWWKKTASFQSFHRNGWTFSVTSKDCAISQLTFSHGFAHNFGADHSSRYLINKRVSEHRGNGGKIKKEFVRTIMQYQQDGVMSHKTNHYSNPNIIHPVTRTRTGKFGVPPNYMHFSTHIAQIAALGDESCICYKHHYMDLRYSCRKVANSNQ